MNPNGAPTLYGQIPGAGSMGGGKGPGYAQWDILEDLFTYATENFGIDWGQPITTEQASELRSKVIRKHYPDGRSPRWGKRAHEGTPSTYHVERIKAMFDKWYLYYPWVDEVAVRRAVDYDPAVWGELTARERTIVVDLLAVHPDPWEANGATDPGPGAEIANPGVTNRLSVTTRALRWFSQPHAVRAPLFAAVNHRKEVMARGAAL